MYLGESKGERRDGEHDFAGRDDHVLRQLPQHVQAIGRGDDHIQVFLQNGSTGMFENNQRILNKIGFTIVNIFAPPIHVLNFSTNVLSTVFTVKTQIIPV